MSVFCNFYLKTQNEGLLDNPFGEIQEDSFFFEKMLNAKHYASGQLLRQIYDLSGKKEFKHTCPDELTMQVLQALFKEQALGYKIADRIEAKKPSTKIETLKRLIIAYEFIHDNIGEQISIEKLSAVSTLSKFHLFNSFKNVFGKTPHQYMNRLKMIKAKEYIEKGHYPISEIADFYGFSDLSVFSKVFKKAYGRPPSYYQSNF